MGTAAEWSPAACRLRCPERRATMTFSGLARRFRGSAGHLPPEREQLIGAMADRTFACPGCARPLPVGQGRCAGCGSYLVAGVLVRTALFLILVGSVVGMVGGAVIAGVAMGPRLAAADAARAVAAAAASTPAVPAAGLSGVMAPAAPAAPGAGHGASSSAPAQSTGAAAPRAGTPTLPSGIAAGLLQVATVNERLARSADALTAMLAGRRAGAAEIAPILRKVAADVRSGDQAARRLVAWSPSVSLEADVAALYGAVASAAADGLAAPLADDAAYLDAGRRMLAALKPLASVDAATRAVADAAGVALPDAAPAP